MKQHTLYIYNHLQISFLIGFIQVKTYIAGSLNYDEHAPGLSGDILWSNQVTVW